MATFLIETTEPSATPQYAWRLVQGQQWYVAQLPGQDGVDWGWTAIQRHNKELDKPVALREYWQRRFRKDMQQLGAKYGFSTINPGQESNMRDYSQCYVHPQEVWDADRCAKAVRWRCAHAPFPGYLPGSGSSTLVCQGGYGRQLCNGGTSHQGQWYPGEIRYLPKLAMGYEWRHVLNWGYRIIETNHDLSTYVGEPAPDYMTGVTHDQQQTG